MTALALRSAGQVNAVSRLHGEVTREMWASIWPGVPEADRPVGSVTNGVHVATWIAKDLADLFTQYLGADWRERHDDRRCGRRSGDPGRGVVGHPPGAQALPLHLHAGAGASTLDGRARRRSASGRRRHAARTRRVDDRLCPPLRRLQAARADLPRPERLARILNGAGRPVQIIFAGKAHPADDMGKHHLQRVYRRALDPLFAGRVAFVDDYDLHVAHFLVQGCDVWLNNPRKPMEASGTSGMKAAINGVPHLSIGDGWWAEGFNGTNGWTIDGGVGGDNYDATDAADATALYRLLEEEVVPAFYDRDQAGVPHRWLAIVKDAIRSVAPRFSARRMVKEYAEKMYAPALERKVTRSEV